MPAAARLQPLALATALLAIALLPGCGGGDSDSGTLTKGEFVARGNEICAQGNKQYAQLQESPPKSAEDAAVLTQKLIEITKSELTQIRALSAPKGLQRALDRYLQARQQGLGVLEQGLEAARNDDFQAFAAAQAKMAASQVDRLKLAQAVGFSQCSRPSGSSSAG